MLMKKLTVIFSVKRKYAIVLGDADFGPASTWRQILVAIVFTVNICYIKKEKPCRLQCIYIYKQ